MTVANTNVSSTYNCNGVTREWNIGFHYNPTLSGLSIVVLHADGTSTEVTANYEIESGVLTYPTVESELDPLPEGDFITITRITPLTQNINLVQQGPLDAETLESGYDKATVQIQEVASKKQDKLKAGANILIDTDGTISATGEIVEGVSWGNVHGTLSNQTDLLTALNAKQDVSNLVTSLSASSTNTQYPSAKVAYDNFELKQPKTLSESITINGTVITTVEGALNALNNRVAKAVGEIFFSQSKNAADNPGSLPLFTGETISNADEVYPQFYAWVASHSELQISAADYTTAISTYGECPKYVIDTTNKTIKLPLLKNYIKMANTADGITQAAAGLPNITGTIYVRDSGTGSNQNAYSGAFAAIDTSVEYTVVNNPGTSYGGSFDASRSSSVYGNSNTVTPAHTTLYPWVYAYNSAVPASIAQAAEFQQALSSKVDLASGVTQADVDYVVESYQSGTSWYRVWKSGWCEQGGYQNGGASVTYLKTFADTSYNLVVSGVLNSTAGNGATVGYLSGFSCPPTRTTTGFTKVGDANGVGVHIMWHACGYLA